MLRNLRERMESEKGFTLIELLVVILIIGILAAIALPAFLGQQKKGQDSEAKSNARNLVTQVESCFSETQDYSQCKTTTNLPDTGLSIGTADGLPANGGDVTVVAASGTPKQYVALAKSKSGQYFAIVKGANGVQTRTCGPTMTTAGAGSGTPDGGCKANNIW